MKFWFDTEFLEDGRTIELISIGVVAEDGREYYAETDFAREKCSTDWLRDNVLPHLTGEEKPRGKIARDLIEFMGQKPEIWAYYADYDWVALCQLHGRMIDLPRGWPMFCRDVKQLADSMGNPKIPEQKSQEHNALADARWTKEAWELLHVCGEGRKIERLLGTMRYIAAQAEAQHPGALAVILANAEAALAGPTGAQMAAINHG